MYFNPWSFKLVVIGLLSFQPNSKYRSNRVPGYSCTHSCISKFRSQYLNLCRYFKIWYRYLHPVPRYWISTLVPHRYLTTTSTSCTSTSTTILVPHVLVPLYTLPYKYDPYYVHRLDTEKYIHILEECYRISLPPDLMTLRWYPSIDYSSMQDPYKSGNWTFFRITTSETFVTSETGNSKFRFWSYCSQKSLWVFTRCSSQWNFERAWLIRPGLSAIVGMHLFR